MGWIGASVAVEVEERLVPVRVAAMILGERRWREDEAWLFFLNIRRAGDLGTHVSYLVLPNERMPCQHKSSIKTDTLG